MAYFPFFVQLEDVPALVIGGGRVALGKVSRLLPYEPHLTMVSPQFLPELEAIPGLTLIRRSFIPEDLEGMSFVVAAAGPEVDTQVARLCRERGLPVNVVDNRDESSFIFPALLRRGDLSVGVSTGGSSPSAAVCLRDEFSRQLPSALEDILTYLKQARLVVRSRIAQGAQREAVMRALCHRCLELNRPLTPAEAEEVESALMQEVLYG